MGGNNSRQQGKVYKNSFIQEIRDYYEQYTDGHGGWEPHFILLGEIEEIIE